MKYRGLVIGCGAIGALLEADTKRPKPATHAGALMRNRRTELVGLVDTDPEVLRKAGKLFPSARTYRNASEALAQETPDIVCIATPASTHESLVRACVEARVKMIVCEKPVAPSEEEARRIETMLSGTGIRFVLNYQRRFFGLFARVEARIRGGTLGRVQSVTCYYSNGLYNNGGHAIDALHFLLNESFDQAIAVLVSGLPNPAGDLNVHAMLRTVSGTTVTLVPLDQGAYGIHDIEIFMEEGALKLTEYGYRLSESTAGPSVFAGVRQLAYARAKVTEKRESMVAGALAEALASLEEEREPVSGIGTGREVLAVLDAIAESARRNGIPIPIMKRP